MKVVVFDGLESENNIINIVKEKLKEYNDEIMYFRLKDMNILPCRSCGSCGCETPGKCVINDDMPKILRAFAPSKLIIMITYVRFGGYSSQLKKAIDRLMVVGTPLYEVKNGHLLHPMRYGSKAFVVIGLIEEEVKGQEKAFNTLVENNALNMQLSYNRTLIFKSSDKIETIENEMTNVLREVNIG